MTGKEKSASKLGPQSDGESGAGVGLSLGIGGKSGGGSSTSLLLDFRRRRNAGESITAKDFLAGTKLELDSESIVDFAFAEFLDDEKKGVEGSEDRIAAEFPQLANEIKRQISFHRALNSADKSQSESRTNNSLTDSPVENANETEADADFLADGSIGSLQIPGVEMVKTLGRGGMGVVYLANQPKLNRLVAVKLLLGGTLASSAHRARFRAEAQAAASLRHPNIVQIDEVGEAHGQPFLIMEYVNGGTLEQFLHEHAPSPRESASFARTIALAVYQAHQQGIVHRDLKPGNILLARQSDAKSPHQNHSRAQTATASTLDAATREPSSLAELTPKIADFGLAKVLPSDQTKGGPTLTMAGDLLGTPSYMAPEQVNDNNAVGPGTDVYSLGAILYQLLSRRPPFLEMSAWETIQQVLKTEPAALPPTVPRDLRTICLKCLQKQPKSRYTSMSQLAKDLDNFLAGKPISARRTTTMERTASWCRRNKAVSILGSLVIVALATVLGISVWSQGRLAKLLDDSKTSRDGEAAAHKQSLANLWDALIAEARAQQTSGRVDQRKKSLDAVIQARDLMAQVGGTPARVAALRDTAAACTTLFDLKKISVWRGPPITKESSFSSDRVWNRVAQFATDKILITEEFGSKRIDEFPSPGGEGLSLSPNGEFLAVWGSDCHVYDLRRIPAIAIASFPSAGWWDFSTNSDKLVGSSKNGLVVVDVKSGMIERTYNDLKTNNPIAFSHDNRLFAVYSGSSIVVVDLYSGTKINEFEAPETFDSIFCLAWHPDNKRIAAGIYSGNLIALWDVHSGQIVRQFRTPQFNFVGLSFDSTGQCLIAKHSWSGFIGVFDTESEKLLVETQGVLYGSVSAEPGGGARMMVRSTSDELVIHEFRSQNVVQSYRANAGSTIIRLLATVSPNDRWLAVSTESGIELFDNATFDRVAELPIGRPFHDRVTFDRNGRLWIHLPNGWLRWKVGESGISAPEFLPTTNNFCPIEVNQDGTWGLVSDAEIVKLVSLVGPSREIMLGNHFDVRNATFSQDSRFVATGGNNSEGGAKVWNAADGRMLAHLKTGQHCEVAFSPDSRFLLTSPNGGEIWDTSNWTLRISLKSSDSSPTGFRTAFSRDSKWLALSRSDGTIQLWDIRSGEIAAVLRYPAQHRANGLTFSVDQNSIIVVGSRDGTVHRWNLTQIKDEMAAIGIPFGTFANLNSDSIKSGDERRLPSDPFSIEESDTTKDLMIKGLRTEAARAMEIRNWKVSLTLLEEIVRVTDEKDERDLNSLAWELLVAPSEFRDPEKSLRYAMATVKLNQDPMYLNTLGTAQFRCGRIREAIESLTKSLGDGSAVSVCFDHYLLACCHAKLDDMELAELHFSKGRETQSAHESNSSARWISEAHLFRTEASDAITAAKARKK